MVQRIGAFLVILFVTYSSIAQNIEGVNARLDAIAGSGICDDIGWTIGNPRSISSFPDQIQGSAINRDIIGVGKAIYGSVVAIKSIGEHFLFGLTANGDVAMGSDYYIKAAQFIEGAGDELWITDANLSKIPRYPHLNLCFKINDDNSIGLGGFIEHTKYEASHKLQLSYDYLDNNSVTQTTNVEYDSTDYKRIFNKGVILDAKITLGPIAWVPQIKAYFPSIKGTRETNYLDKAGKGVLDGANLTGEVTATNSNVTWESSFEKNYFLQGSSMLWTDIGNTFWIVGVWYGKKSYKFQKNMETEIFTTGGATTIDKKIVLDTVSYKWESNAIDWFLGCQPSFSDNLYLAPEYDGGIEFAKRTGDSYDTTEISSTYIYHTFRLGIERPVKDFLFLDTFTPRFGLRYRWSREIVTRKLTPDAINNIIQQNIENAVLTNIDGEHTETTRMKITAGLGFQKGRCTFDISMYLLEWQYGLITGPAASMASITVDISKKK